MKGKCQDFTLKLISSSTLPVILARLQLGPTWSESPEAQAAMLELVELGILEGCLCPHHAGRN